MLLVCYCVTLYNVQVVDSFVPNPEEQQQTDSYNSYVVDMLYCRVVDYCCGQHCAKPQGAADGATGATGQVACGVLLLSIVMSLSCTPSLFVFSALH
jgi:hypothetical protein